MLSEMHVFFCLVPCRRFRRPAAPKLAPPMNNFMCIPSIFNVALFSLVFFVTRTWYHRYGMRQPPTPDSDKKVMSIAPSDEINGKVEGEIGKQGERTEHAFIFSVL